MNTSILETLIIGEMARPEKGLDQPQGRGISARNGSRSSEVPFDWNSVLGPGSQQCRGCLYYILSRPHSRECSWPYSSLCRFSGRMWRHQTGLAWKRRGRGSSL